MSSSLSYIFKNQFWGESGQWPEIRKRLPVLHLVQYWTESSPFTNLTSNQLPHLHSFLLSSFFAGIVSSALGIIYIPATWRCAGPPSPSSSRSSTSTTTRPPSPRQSQQNTTSLYQTTQMMTLCHIYEEIMCPAWNLFAYHWAQQLPRVGKRRLERVGTMVPRASV